MAVKKVSASAEMLSRLKSTDISFLIKISGVMLPRVIDSFLASLDKKQRSIIDKILPAGGVKKIYFQLVDSPTPPIVIKMAQPLLISTMAEKEVRQQRIRGIRLKVDDVRPLAEGRTTGKMLKLLWRLKGQMFTILGILWMFAPLLRLGRSGLKDMQNKLTSQWKPLLDILAR